MTATAVNCKDEPNIPTKEDIMSSRFFTIVTKDPREVVERYLYGHSRIVSAAFKMPDYSTASVYMIETTGDTDANALYSAEYQAGRFASGLMAPSPVAWTYQEAVDRLVDVRGAEVLVNASEVSV